MRKFTVIYEPIKDNSFEAGYYYAHIPALGLTTHGLGLEGAKTAAFELLDIWVDDTYDERNDIIVSTLEVA